RKHLDKYRIEQIALRRLRFVIDNNEAHLDHLSIVDLIQQSDVPPSIISEYFGASYKTACDIRVLLLQSIEKSVQIKSTKENKENQDVNNTKDVDSLSPHQSQMIQIFTPRIKATTPDDVLEMLEEVIIRSATETNYKRESGKPSFHKHTSLLRKASRPSSALSIAATERSIAEAESSNERLANGKFYLRQLVTLEQTEQDEAITRLQNETLCQKHLLDATLIDPVLKISGKKLLRMVART
ncbi:hypothetical protein HK096_009868, partial [Nowakowskiella sp. JEL0078]